MSTIEVNKVTPVSGGTNLQIGESGDTVDLSNATTTMPTSLITGQTEKTTLVDADKFLISDSAASGAFKYVQKSNVSSPAVLTQVATVSETSMTGTITFASCFTSTYTNYFIVFDRIQVGTNGSDFRMLWHYGNSNGNDSQYHHFSALHRYPSTTDAWSGVNQSYVKLGQAQKSGAGNYINGFMYMYHPLSRSDGVTSGVWELQSNSNNGSGSAVTVGSLSNGESGANSAYTGFQFFASTGNILGNVTVYGITNPS